MSYPKTFVQMGLPCDELEALDAYRRQQVNPPSRAQAARDLINFALALRASVVLDEEEHAQRASFAATSQHEHGVVASMAAL